MTEVTHVWKASSDQPSLVLDCAKVNRLHLWHPTFQGLVARGARLWSQQIYSCRHCIQTRTEEVPA